MGWEDFVMRTPEYVKFAIGMSVPHFRYWIYVMTDGDPESWSKLSTPPGSVDPFSSLSVESAFLVLQLTLFCAPSVIHLAEQFGCSKKVIRSAQKLMTRATYLRCYRFGLLPWVEEEIVLRPRNSTDSIARRPAAIGIQADTSNSPLGFKPSEAINQRSMYNSYYKGQCFKFCSVDTLSGWIAKPFPMFTGAITDSDLLNLNQFPLYLAKWLEAYLERTPPGQSRINSVVCRTDKGFLNFEAFEHWGFELLRAPDKVRSSSLTDGLDSFAGPRSEDSPDCSRTKRQRAQRQPSQTIQRSYRWLSPIRGLRNAR